MRNASGHNYWSSSFIMDVAIGQTPRSTERISSYKGNYYYYYYYSACIRNADFNYHHQLSLMTHS